jgi:hypothetical protein
MSNPDRLTAIKARCEKATGGPWFVIDKPGHGVIVTWREDTQVCVMRWTDGMRPEVEARVRADAEAIAHAREDLPWAMSRLEQLQEDVQRAADMLLGGYADRLKIQGLLQAALDRSKDSAALAQTAGKGEPSTTHLSQAEIDELNDCEG